MKAILVLTALPALFASPALAGVDEFRLGLSAHDVSVLGHGKEDGVDGVAEVLFRSPDYLQPIWAPRLHVGIGVNSVGDTSQLYAGLTWNFEPVERLFVEFSVGGAVHDGKLVGDPLERKQLGSRALFCKSLALGWRFNKNHSLMVVFDHESNARLADHNEGLNNFGVRWGYRF